ncbi:MAG: phytoene/squalene synthase family protein [Chloroflexota bacterium]
MSVSTISLSTNLLPTNSVVNAMASMNAGSGVNWETKLLSLAHGDTASSHHHEYVHVSPHILTQAYQYCEEMTAYHSKSFYMASSLLPAHKRRAIRALYAFCRVSDDIVDEHEAHTAVTLLQNWRQQTIACYSPTGSASSTVNTSSDLDRYALIALAWADARRQYDVPQRYAEQLLDGVAIDLAKHRYETFDELAAYGYGVASTVGLMSMHIIGYAGSEAIPYAIKLGVALQMTNILRDVAEDWRNGRLYLPQEELARFGLDEEYVDYAVQTGAMSQHSSAQNPTQQPTQKTTQRVAVDGSSPAEKWRAFMQFQIARNRQLYAEAWPGIGLLSRSGRFAIAAAADLYQGILDDIEAHQYDVFTRRAHLSQSQKLRRLPSIWWRSRNA